MMEMANAGLIDVLVVDDWKAKMWAQILPKIAVHEDVSVHDAGQVGWTIRKDSPLLAAAIADFLVNDAKLRASHAYRLAQATKRVKQMQDPTARRTAAVRGGARAVPPLWRALRVRSADARRAGFDQELAARSGGARATSAPSA